MYHETRSRSIVKTVSWRVCATLITVTLVFAFTGKLDIAFAVGGVEVFTKLLFYFFHERAWNKLKYGKKHFKPFVLWFTGLSGSGKSTLAEKVYNNLKKEGYKVERLDGDVVRSLFPRTGFSKEDRDDHVKRVGFLASLLEKSGVIVICSFISPYRETRNIVRNLCKQFIEVHVSASVEECEKRDVKGLYKKVRAGEITNFTGVDHPYEAPENCEILVDTEQQDVKESLKQIKDYLKKRIIK